MKFHIVRNGESLQDILFLYNLTKDELVEENRHIRVWDKLIPGTKLKIPPIPEAIEQDVNDMEPFVEDYYPKLHPNKDTTEEVIFKEENNDEEHKIDDLNSGFQEFSIDDEKSISADQIVQNKQSINNEPLIDEQLVVNQENIPIKKSISEDKVEEMKEKIQKEIHEHMENDKDEGEIAYQPIYKPVSPNYYPYYLGYNNYPRYVPYPIIYYPIYYQKRSY